MIKFNSNNINKWLKGTYQINKVYKGEVSCYPDITNDAPTPPTPTGSTCYEIISTPISAYSSTTYDSVYSYADNKWYMLNNLNQYEEYGVYDVSGSSLSDYTTYEGKLAVIGTTEYQYSGGTWVTVGTYEDVTVTYAIDRTDQYKYSGQTISTTLKILMTELGSKTVSIYDENNNYLQITRSRYRYVGPSETGTITNDGTYYYCSLPTTQSILISKTTLNTSGTVNVIAGSKQISVVYQEKSVPEAQFYNTVSEMEVVGCPTVGINQFAMVSTNLYEYSANEDWEQVPLTTPKMVGFYSSGNPLVVYNNSNSTLTSNEIKSNGSLVSVIIGDSVTEIGNNAFKGCTGLTSIDIPNSVTSIGNSTFSGCYSLTTVNIPNGVTSIGQYAFNGCSSLTSITVDSANIVYDSRNNCNAIIETSSNTLVQGCSTTIIPNTVTSIGEGAFAYNTSLTSITIGSGITSIGNSAFAGCTSLTSIYIPSGVTSIGDFAFVECSGLTSITVDNIEIPELGDYAFDNGNECPIYVPAEAVYGYKAVWGRYASRIEAIPT